MKKVIAEIRRGWVLATAIVVLTSLLVVILVFGQSKCYEPTGSSSVNIFDQVAEVYCNE